MVLEIAGRLLAALRSGERVAVATSVDVIGSAPHLAGTSMAVTAAGAVIGSVSAGCVEASALDACRALLHGGAPQQLRFGFGEADAARAGLACGGELDVFVHPLGGAALEQELEAAAAGRSAAVGFVVAGPAEALGGVVAGGEGAGLGGEVDPAQIKGASIDRLRSAVAARALTGRSGPVSVDCGSRTVRLFVDVAAPAARLVIVGATETAAALAAAASAVGYAVTVCDHRDGFAAAERFPAAEQVVVALPHEYLAATALDGRSAVCLLGHDEDLDPLAAAVALERGVAYVGALGSRGTTARRRERLLALGLDDALVDRLHAPIGLDIGASTPAETAVSILAEVLAARTGAQGARLRTLTGPIHRSGTAEQERSPADRAPRATASLQHEALAAAVDG